MKKLTLLFLLMVSNSSFAWSVFGPKDYDECILQNMKGVNTDVGAKLINKSCSEKFKEKEIDDSKKDRWTLFSSDEKMSNSVEKWPGNQGKQRRKLSTLIYVMIRYFAGETLGVIYGLYCRNQKTSFYKW